MTSLDMTYEPMKSYEPMKTYETIGVDPLDLNIEPLGVINNNNNNIVHQQHHHHHKVQVPADREPKESSSKAQKCPHCHREFTNLRHHINQQHMQVKNFKCTECGYSCYLKTDLERHINNVHDKFRSPCPICGKKYSDLRQHVRIVHEGAKAECPHCKGKYSNLSQHIHKVHLKTKNIMCDKCGMTFYHNSNLKKHIETVHATQHKLMAPIYHGGHLDSLMPADPCSDNLYNLRHGFNTHYDGYSGYPAYHHHMTQSYHQHNHYYPNNVYYGRQWW